MKYMGSKSRIANQIVPIIQSYIDKNNIQTYVEPFCGGANIIDKIKCKNKYASDVNKYLIALLSYVAQGGKLLEEVDKALYSDARSNVESGKYPDWMIGNIGFLASYNGRWFDGGFAKPGYEKTKNGVRYRDYYKESKANLLNQKPNLKDIIFSCCDYKDYLGNIENSVIYCDPPYKNVKQYSNSKRFDHDEFWNVIRGLSQNNIVLVSELQAPDDFECIWKQEVSRSIKANDKSKATEKLYKLIT